MIAGISNRRNIVFFILILYLIIVKSHAIGQLIPIADESGDLYLLNTLFTMETLTDLADDPEQARLPHLISLPFAIAFGQDYVSDSLIPIRLLFVFIHCFYLIVFYKMLRLKFSEAQSLYCLCLTALSTYLFSFSIFTMTTSNNLFLLFSTCTIYYYLKNYEDKVAYSLKQIFTISILIGLMMASKLHGLVVLFAIVLYDAIRKFDRCRSLPVPQENIFKSRLGKINTLFTVLLIFANLLEYFPKIKAAAIICLSLSYVLFLTDWYFKKREEKTYNSSFALIFFILHFAFNLTLLFSPIYLNLKNVLILPAWFRNWGYNPGVLVNPSHFDAITIIGIKFGWVSLLALILSSYFLIRFKEFRQFFRKYLLFLIIFIVFLVAISIPQWIVTWYPLLIFPFLYIPISALITYRNRLKTKLAQTLLIAFCLMIPVYEQGKYLQLFPYGHIDGYQYGEHHVGWHKSAFITFEYLPFLYDYLKKQSLDMKEKEIFMVVYLVDSKPFNRWAVQETKLYFQEKGFFKFLFVDIFAYPGDISNKYLLTGIYSDKDRVTELTEGRYTKIHDIKLKTLKLLSIWKPLQQDDLINSQE